MLVSWHSVNAFGGGMGIWVLATPVPCCTMQPHQKNLFCPPILSCSASEWLSPLPFISERLESHWFCFFFIAEYSARNIALDKKRKKCTARTGKTFELRESLRREWRFFLFLSFGEERFLFCPTPVFFLCHQHLFPFQSEMKEAKQVS